MISRLAVMSVVPGMARSSVSIRLASCRSVGRSSPKTSMASAAGVPERMWLSRCSMGCPTVAVTPGTSARIASISSRNLASSAPGFIVTSMSELLTGSACSSRSARPVRRVTLWTPVISAKRRSMPDARRSLSLSDVPGGAIR